jgi:beta-glucosidase
VDRLGDRVSRWSTHNEPWCISVLGHEEGHHAPGHRDGAEALRVAHHVLLSHGLAAEAIRDRSSQAKVGIVLMHVPVQPATESAADRNAARWLDGFFNRWYLEPIFRGIYPPDVISDRRALGHLDDGPLPFVQAGDLRTISTPLDFLGINYYSRAVVKAGPDGRPVDVPQVPADELTDMGWEVYPDGLRQAVERLYQDYAPAELFITENGAAYDVPADADGRIHDRRRVEYLREHLVSAHRAIQAGVPLRGYFAWSLLDNFEWGHGFEKRFGLYAVDFDTQQRMQKDSAAWFAKVCSSNAVATDSATETQGASRVSQD